MQHATLIMVLILASATSSCSRNASVLVTPESLVLPQLFSGQRVTNVFCIRNTTGADVGITRVKSDCGCTVADIGPSTLSPKEERQFEVVFDSAGKSGFQQHVVAFETDAGPARLTLSTRVIPPIRLFPDVMNASIFPNGWFRTNVLVRFADGYSRPKLQQLSLQPDNLSVSAKLQEGSRIEGTYRLELEVDIAMAIASMTPRMAVRVTDLRNGAFVTFVLQLHYQLPVKIEPSSINLGLISSTTKNRFSVTVKQESVADIGVLSAKPSHAWMETGVEQVDRGIWRVHFTLLEKPKEDQTEPLFVELTTKSPQLPVWRVPVVFAVVQTNRNACCGQN